MNNKLSEILAQARELSRGNEETERAIYELLSQAYKLGQQDTLDSMKQAVQNGLHFAEQSSF